MYLLFAECTLLTSLNCAPGVRVERGKAWAWGDEDSFNGKPGYGTVKACHFENHVGAIVIWDNGNIKKYSVDEMDKNQQIEFSRKYDDFLTRNPFKNFVSTQNYPQWTATTHSATNLVYLSAQSVPSFTLYFSAKI